MLDRRAALVATFVALASCGGHDFDGAYEGEVERRPAAASSGAAASETWELDVRGAVAHRTRGGERCDLALEKNTCSRGCYDKVVLAGQTCALDGRTMVLAEGFFESQAADIPQRSIRLTLKWSAAPGGDVEVVESGLLAEAD